MRGICDRHVKLKHKRQGLGINEHWLLNNGEIISINQIFKEIVLWDCILWVKHVFAHCKITRPGRRHAQEWRPSQNEHMPSLMGIVQWYGEFDDTFPWNSDKTGTKYNTLRAGMARDEEILYYQQSQLNGFGSVLMVSTHHNPYGQLLSPSQNMFRNLSWYKRRDGN